MKKCICRIIPSVVLALTLLISACGKKPAEQSEAETSEAAIPLSVTLTPQAIKTADIQSEAAEIRPIDQTIRVAGEVIFNLKRQAHVTARTEGRIEQISAYPGDKLQKGQILLSLYSREFLSLQAELLQALDRSKRVHSDPAESKAAQALLNSVRNRLRLLDVSSTDLSDIESSGQLKSLLAVRSPLSGNVIDLSVKAGDYAELGASLFQIADLSNVWVDFHLFEKDLASVAPGCEVVIRTGAFPDREFRSRLFQIGNIVDEKARTLEGRAELDNPQGDLRPGMFIEAEITPKVQTRLLLIPAAAIQDFQNRKVVFVRTGDHTFKLREVETGISSNGYMEIRRGLKEHEIVATHGSFFIKSELLKNSLGGG
jgi:Cu(I)/Ag(I) efflux system membrane fusion protein